MMISALKPVHAITDDDKKKPALYKLYNFRKGGTDIMDQKMGSYAVKARLRKSTKVAKKTLKNQNFVPILWENPLPNTYNQYMT